jgi:sugar phosphate isomerase/epimerase
MKALICVDPALAELPFLDRIQKAVEIGYDSVELWNWDCTDTDAEPTTPSREWTEVLWIQANRGGSLIRAEHRERVGAGVRAPLDEAREMSVKALLLLTDKFGQHWGVVQWFRKQQGKGGDGVFSWPADLGSARNRPSVCENDLKSVFGRGAVDRWVVSL